jgi:molybdopterin synthase sulfur carrier subunit
MMQVKLFGNLRQHTGQLEVAASGTTIGAVLHELCATYPTLENAIFDGDQVQTHVRVMINGRDIELADGLNTKVSETDQIAVFPPIAGG